MFTGIIIEAGEVISIKKTSGITRLSISTKTLYKDALIGDSIAINGVCLTVVDISDKIISFELSDETLRSTNLGDMRHGEKINLEPALRADGKLGGHFVTGHVDAVGKIRSKKRIGETIEIDIDAPPLIMDLLVDKGSVAVDGISLTVVKVFKDFFRLVIIPHTENVTNIGDKGSGSSVNLETDIIGKYVKKFLPSGNGEGIMDKLNRSGFLGT
ncbi:MAG: riboflavin synthase [Nitrospirota bacterium]|nr:MAG: riboflavin synthase [Nitrospirota bacterium]